MALCITESWAGSDVAALKTTAEYFIDHNGDYALDCDGKGTPGKYAHIWELGEDLSKIIE